MDNDVQGTEYCIGFSTAITRAKDAINRQRTTIGSHERIGVFRIFGRDAGFHRAVHGLRDLGTLPHPESPYDIDQLATILRSDHAGNPSHYALVITAEGAIWKAAASRGRRAGRLRPSSQGQRGGDPGRRAEGPHRHRHHPLRPHLRPALRRAGLVDQMVGIVFANTAMELVADGQRAA